MKKIKNILGAPEYFIMISTNYSKNVFLRGAGTALKRPPGRMIN
jgi:hypothetical protein